MPMPQPVFLSGNVVLEDGTSPPFGAVIELNCGGLVTREANVGGNGYFSFQVGGDNRFGQILPDASQGYDQRSSDITDSGGATADSPQRAQARLQQRRLFGCELRADLHGYKSTSLNIKEEPLPGPNRIGTIVVYPAERATGTSVSYTNLLAPKPAKRIMAKAEKAFQKGDFENAAALFRSALAIYPKFAEAWFDLGSVYETQRRKDEARQAYNQAINADKMYIKPYIRLAQLASAQQNWHEALELSEQVLLLDPVSYIDAYYFSAVANYNLNRLDAAEDRARHGERIDVSNHLPGFHLVLAAILGEKQDREGAIRELRSYLKSAPDASNVDLVRSQLQKMESQAQVQ